MNALTDKKIRFSDAADAIDATPKSLRKWLQNPDFSLLFEPPAGEWIAFSVADVAMLAVARKLVDFGVGVAPANEIAREVVLGRLGPLARSRKMPPDAIVSVFLGHSLAVWVTDGDWLFSVQYGDDALPDEPAFILIDLEAVVSTAISHALGGAE